MRCIRGLPGMPHTLYYNCNGPLQLDMLLKMPTVLTPPLASVQNQQGVAMVTYRTPPSPSSDWRASAQLIHGMMTIYSQESLSSISQSATHYKKSGTVISFPEEENTKLVGEYGLVVEDLRMEHLTNLLRTATSCSGSLKLVTPLTT